ncbi:MAG TPA: hypothetical protein VLV15_13495, partial [Dongiaceae bacterium]|nr:hypothetical protein [Dongiaceae bacterium]
MAEHFRCATGEIPLIREARRDPQRALLAPTADHERRPRPLHRFRLAPRAGEPVVRALEVGDLAGEQQVDDRTGFFEPVEALPQRRELDAVRGALLLVPPGAETDLQAPARDDVEARGHVGEHGRVTIRVAGHHDAEAQATRDSGERGEHRPALEARAGAILLE